MVGYSDIKEIEIIEKVWRCGRNCVGIILAENKKTRKQCAYIGSSNDNNAEEEDAHSILDWGYRMTYEEAKPFLKRIDASKYCNEPDGLI